MWSLTFVLKSMIPLTSLLTTTYLTGSSRSIKTTTRDEYRSTRRGSWCEVPFSCNILGIQMCSVCFPHLMVTCILSPKFRVVVTPSLTSEFCQGTDSGSKEKPPSDISDLNMTKRNLNLPSIESLPTTTT